MEKSVRGLWALLWVLLLDEVILDMADNGPVKCVQN